MWFKKKAKISGFNANTAYDGTDWRINGNVRSWIVSQTLPSAADAGNYFYLPALGGYGDGQLYDVGNTGYYWSSSADPRDNGYAYYLFFSDGTVSVRYHRSYYGWRVGGFE